MGLHQRKAHKRVKPPQKGLIQWLLSKAGREIYQAADGLWYLACSIFGRKRRDVQTGRGYNFTGVELVNWGSITIDNLSQNNFSIPILGYFDSVTSYGIVVFGRNRLIVYNDASCGVIYNDSGNFQQNIRSSTGFIPLDQIIKITFERVHNQYFRILVNDVEVYKPIVTSMFDHTSWSNELRLLGGQSLSVIQLVAQIFRVEMPFGKYVFEESAGLRSYDASGNEKHGTNDLGGSAESGFHITSDEVPSAQNEVGYNVKGTDPANVNAYVPIDQSGTGKTDVLGNTVDKNQHGPVQYPGRIKGSSCLTPDGNITLTHPDLTGITIISSVGSSTPTKSGNDILMTSGDLLELVLSNGSRYQWSETANLKGIDTVGTDDLTINLNGSSAGSQWGGSDEQTPYNLRDGYYIDAGDDGTRSPGSRGIYTIFVPPKLNSITPTENTYNRNPFDAPALVGAGIPDTEDISYEDITDDKSRFYDNAETDRIVSMLAYSYSPEPIAGSAGNFDGNIDLTHPDLTGITIISWVGTSTPTKSGNDILVTAGILTELVLSDGSKYIFGEEKALTYYDLLKQNNLTVNLNGSALGTQFLQDGNKDYHHNLLWGKSVGAIFNGTTSGKLSEPNNTDSAWQIQGFKVEIDIIITAGVVYQTLYNNTRVETGKFSGFKVDHSVDGIVIQIAHTSAGLNTYPISLTVDPDVAYNIVVWKKPSGTTLNVIINGVLETEILLSASINYDAAGVSINMAGAYNHNLTTYDKQTPCRFKKLHVTEINDDKEEVNGLINIDNENGDDTTIPNVAVDAPIGSDVTWLSGTGDYTGCIPGDLANFWFDVEGNNISNLSKVRNYRTIKAFLRRNS